MRIKEDVTKSTMYSSLLFKISSGINYNQILSRKLNMKPNALIEHLKRLEKESLLLDINFL